MFDKFLHCLLDFFWTLCLRGYFNLILLGEPKYGPGSKPHWKAGSDYYPAFYKALLDEP